MITEFSKIVCIPELDILGKSKKRNIVDARHLYWLIMSENGFRCCEIARSCGITHASVINGTDRMKVLLKIGDQEITKLYHQCKNIKRHEERQSDNTPALQSQKKTIDINLRKLQKRNSIW